MARMYPKQLPAGTERSEVAVYDALSELADDWFVIHDLQFLVPGTPTRPAINGQIDFVLLNQRQGLLVIEAKGGGYEVSEGVWFTFPRGRREEMARSPFEQARSNRYALTDYLTAETGLRGLPAGHAVAFPDGAPRGNLGPAAPSVITLDGLSLKNIVQTLAQVCSHWFAGPARGVSLEQFDRVLSVLAPTAAVVADRRYVVDTTLVDVHGLTERQIELTDEQFRVVVATTGAAHVAVLGAAGTGKTVIATRRAQQLASQGRRVLLLADQRYLHDALRHQPGLKHGNITLGTPEEVLTELSQAPGVPGTPLWERILDLASDGPLFDVVIIDEAQALEDDLLEALYTLSGSAVHVYADPYQRDAAGMWRPPGKPESFWLTRNCRNSHNIAKLVSKVSGSFPPNDGASGPRPRFIEVSKARDIAYQQAVTVVIELLSSLAPREVAVLNCGSDLQNLAAALRTAAVPVARKPGDDGVTLLHAPSFRGCEAPVVVLVSEHNSPCGANAATAHYIATSRAVADLTVIGHREDWEQYTYLMESE